MEKKDSSIWKKGKYVDFWSVVHAFFGVLSGSFVAILSLPFTPSIVVFTAIAIVWEVYELSQGFEETNQNRFLDVVIGLATFIIVYVLFVYIVVVLPVQIAVFFVSAVLFLILNLFGWQRSQKRT